jgi:hypothetical protein
LHIINLEDYVAQELDRVSFFQQRRNWGWSTLILAILTAGAMTVTLLSHRLGWLAAALTGATTLAGGAFLYYEQAFRRHTRLRNQLGAGLRGQRFVARVLSCLDDSFYLVNNLKLPGRADDVDHVVVGPNGLFALETKHHRGRIFWQDGQWYQSKMSRSGILQPDEPIRDPVAQLKRNVAYLRSCINATNRPLSQRTGLWIEGAVVFTHPAASIDIPEDSLAAFPFPVLKIRDLPTHVAGHVPRRFFTAAEVRAIVDLLAHLEAPEWNKNGNPNGT